MKNRRVLPAEKLRRLFLEQGIDFEKVNYYIKPFTKSKMKSLLDMMIINPDLIQRQKVERGIWLFWQDLLKG